MMTARSVFLKLAAFFFAFAAAVAVVALFRPAPPRRPVFTRPAPPPFALAEHLETEVELISLDRRGGRSYARLTLRLAGRSLPPERLWVRTYFFNPSGAAGRYWADDAVELVRPFAEGRTATVTVSAPCSWCDDEGMPAGGYFARVQIFDGREETPLPAGARADDIRTAVPVVVHVDGVPPARP